MFIAIMICIYWIWIIDVYKSYSGNISTMIPSTMIVILMAWEQNQTWGIMMTCFGVVCVMVGLIKYFHHKNDYKK